MGLTVFAQNMGLFHKGSNGTGIAPVDVCLTPPPPPAGPIPVPYVNILQASNLSKGSKSVKIDGQPTALENASQVSRSNGDEAGTQKGVVTMQNMGKGSFKLWSFTVKAEGKGVARHGDLMGQNHMSDPPNCVDPAAVTSMSVVLGADFEKPCTETYDDAKHRPPLNKPHFDKVAGGPCWECDKLPDPPEVWDTSIVRVNKKRKMHDGTVVTKPNPKKRKHNRSPTDDSGSITQEGYTPDHQPPLNLAWAMGGCHMQPSPDAFLEYMGETDRVVPHCNKHSNSQGSTVRAYAKRKYPTGIK